MSPVHCAIWPRCLKVLLKYLIAVMLVSGDRSNGYCNPVKFMYWLAFMSFPFWSWNFNPTRLVTVDAGQDGDVVQFVECLGCRAVLLVPVLCRHVADDLPGVVIPKFLPGGCNLGPYLRTVERNISPLRVKPPCTLALEKSEPWQSRNSNDTFSWNESMLRHLLSGRLLYFFYSFTRIMIPFILNLPVH